MDIATIEAYLFLIRPPPRLPRLRHRDPDDFAARFFGLLICATVASISLCRSWSWTAPDRHIAADLTRDLNLTTRFRLESPYRLNYKPCVCGDACVALCQIISLMGGPPSA
jgi:hypothetical protein